MKKRGLVLAVFSVVLLAFSACKKVEGEGGSSSIIGKIIANKKNSSGVVIATYDAQKQDVFIIYGEGETVHDDKVETSYNGNFEFNYLEKGTYTIYTYEKCNTCPSGDQAIFRTIEITKSKEINNIGTIEITD